MQKITFTYPTPEGSREIIIDSERTTFGRGSEAVHRFSDDGLSRLHATVYREGDQVWIVDENSSNGTFVNGVHASPAGTPLHNGDVIRIGHRTELNVRIAAAAEAETPVLSAAPPPDRAIASPGGISLVPVALIAFAIMIVSISAVFIGYTVLGSGKPEVVQDDFEADDPYPNPPSKTPRSGPEDKEKELKSSSTTFAELNPKVPQDPGPTVQDLLKNRKYLELSEPEKRKYVGDRAMKIAQIIGNNSSEPIPAEALDKIKAFVDAYAKRVNVKPLSGCRFGDNLQVTYERASKNAPFIIKAFNEKGTDPRIGLYLAMIESEHCVCLQSPTGPLGMFQFTKATGELHGLKTVRGASPSNPDERCEPEPSARAAASYMKALTGRYGTGPASVPLAIGSYNSGEGGLSSNLVKALESNSGLPRDFWTLIANGEKLSKQFQAENFKYVPKFFAAAIIGENPQDFGLRLQPLSTYSG